MKLSAMTTLLRPRSIHISRQQRILQGAYSVEALRKTAHARLPGPVYDYIDGGAEDEAAIRNNRHAYERINFVPRVCQGISSVDLSVELFGQRYCAPIILGPTGFTRIVDSDGERAVARGARDHDTPYVLSTMSTCSIEDIAGSPHGPLWFQLYTLKDKEFCADLIRRAKDAGYQQLVLTVDNASYGARERDIRNGLTIPPSLSMRTVLSGIAHPRWSTRFLTSPPIEYANLSLPGQSAADRMEEMSNGFDGNVTWDYVQTIQDQWGAPIILKGVASSEDAAHAQKFGLAGVVLSNHGGRQLDYAAAPVDLVPEVRRAVGPSFPVLVDSGVRRGSDIAKALCAGANGVLIGRPYLYGLAAAGPSGVAKIVEILTSELRRALGFLGVTSISELDETFIERP